MIDLSRPAAPSRPQRRDWFAPAVVAGSLLVHAAIVTPLIWSPHAEAARPATEIPVEVVQMPPEAPKPAAKAAAKPPEPRQQAQAKPPVEKPVAKPPAEKQKSAERQQPEPKKPEPKQPEAKIPEAKRPQPKQASKPPEQSVAQRMTQLIGPMPAMAMPSLTGADNPLDDSVSYRQLVLSQVARQKRDDRHDGIPGHAVIAFAIGDHGEVVNCEVREKSVDPQLDAEAMAMVYRGAPYPAPPPGAERAFSFGLAFHTL